MPEELKAIDQRPAPATGLNINQTNTDLFVFSIPFAKYIVRRVTFFDASTSLGASLATLGVFTASAGGGTAVVNLALVQALTASTKFVDATIAATTDYLTSATLYVRSGVTHGAAATLSCAIEVQRVG